MEFHPAASIFPMLSNGELEDLAANIRERGLLEPIRTLDGKILDGRNRFKACELAGVEPVFEPADVGDSAADYVYAVNFYRRHLNEGSRRLAAGRYKDIAAREAKDRQRQHGGTAPGRKNTPGESAGSVRADARDVAAEKFGVGAKTVDAAEKVVKHGAPELIQAVEQGKIKVSRAEKLARAPKKKQAEALAAGPDAIADAIDEHERKKKKDKPAPVESFWSYCRQKILDAIADALVEHDEPNKAIIPALLTDMADKWK